MKKWSVTACMSGSKHLGSYEAETGEEAIVMALDSGEAQVSLCHQCTSECEDGEATQATATCGDVEVRWSEGPSWEEQARAAGWTPPKKRRAKRYPASHST